MCIRMNECNYYLKRAKSSTKKLFRKFKDFVSSNRNGKEKDSYGLDMHNLIIFFPAHLKSSNHDDPFSGCSVQTQISF